jgi:hypothetical protein
MRRLVSFLFGFPVLFACNSSTVPPGRVQVAIDGAAFEAPTSVLFSIRNETAETIFVSSCGERVLPAIERFRQGQWENAAAAICPAILPMVPAELRSGETLTDSIRIAEPGQYRVVVSYGSGVVRVLYLTASTAFLVQ